jgi:phenylacetate-CoA ligase
MATVFDPLRLGAVALDVMATSQGNAWGIHARQQLRLQQLVAVARRRSPLYREKLAHLAPSDWTLADLPVVHKKELMGQFDQWVTDSAIRWEQVAAWLADPRQIGEPFLGKYLVWESSGSSHEAGVFLQDAQSLAVYDALETLRCSRPRSLLRWMDPLFLTEKIAFIGALGGHFSSLVSMQRLRQIHPFMAQRLQCFSILQPTHDLLAGLDDFQPTMIATYPSVACVLADAKLQGGWKCSIKELWLGGETLSPAVRRHVEQVLGCTVRNNYGSSECMAMGWECSQGYMHINSDWLILEAVDAQTTLLTNLANHVQPLIRYNLGDQISVQSEPCACGSPFLRIEVIGRTDASLQLSAEGGGVVTLLPLAIVTVLEEQAGVFDFQVVQTDYDSLLVRLPESAANPLVMSVQCATVLQQFVRSMGLTGVKIATETVPALERGSSGKVQRVLKGGRDAPLQVG